MIHYKNDATTTLPWFPKLEYQPYTFSTQNRSSSCTTRRGRDGSRKHIRQACGKNEEKKIPEAMTRIKKNCIFYLY
jgi:hypothetical protein